MGLRCLRLMIIMVNPTVMPTVPTCSESIHLNCRWQSLLYV
jgi:hypothetical protein